MRERNLQALPITLVRGRVIGVGAYVAAADLRAALVEPSR